MPEDNRFFFEVPITWAVVTFCTYECTFCRDCGENVLKGVCPNCGGNLVTRPIRTAAKLAKDPASTVRKLRQGGCAGVSAA